MLLLSMQAGTEPASTARKLTRRSTEEAEPQEVFRQAVVHESTATTGAVALPDAADTAAMEAVSEQTADPGAIQSDASVPHAMAEDEGVPDQAPATGSAVAQQTPAAGGAAASDKPSWRRAEGSAPAAANTAAFPTAELAKSLHPEDLEAADSGAALFSQPQLSASATTRTAGAAAGELPVAGAGSAAGDAAAAMLQQLQQQPNRVLDEAQVEAGISYVGHNARLRRLMRRLGQGEAISVGANTVERLT